MGWYALDLCDPGAAYGLAPFDGIVSSLSARRFYKLERPLKIWIKFPKIWKDGYPTRNGSLGISVTYRGTIV